MTIKTFEYRGFTFMPCAYQDSARWYARHGIQDERSCPQFATKAECRVWADQQTAANAWAESEAGQIEAQFASLPID
jgi:hypothetical protein